MPHEARTRHGPRALALAAAALAFTESASAQTGPGLLMEPFPKEQLIHANGGALFLDSGHVKGSDQSARLSFFETTGRVRIKPGLLESPRVGWDLELIDVDLGRATADTNPELGVMPGQLLDQSVGVAFPVAKVDQWIFGVALGLGYAGGSPYGESNAFYGKATAVAFRQFSETDALVFVIDYDRNRTFLPDTPLPGIAYTRRVSKELFYVVGLPLSSVTWTPFDKLTVEFGWLPIESFDAAIGYAIAPHWTVFGNLEQRSGGFFLDEVEDGDRLLFQHRRAEVGVSWAPGRPRERFALTAAAGYAWGQEFSVGFDARDSDLVADFSDEPYVRFGFEVKF